VTRATRREAVVWICVLAITIAAVAAVVASAALPKLNKARDFAEEAWAIKAIQTLNTAQVQFKSKFGRYARSLAELGPSAANLIPANLSAGKKYGYKFKLTGTPAGYAIAAVPVSTRTLSFRSDQSLAIRGQ
jgi:type II secretory pathway pseudopilin PulG